MQEIFDPSQIEKQLLLNYQKQTLTYQQCFTNYSKLIKDWNIIRQRCCELEEEIAQLKMELADKKLIDGLKSEKEHLEEINSKLLHEIDILNKSVSIMTINFNEAEEKFNEKKAKNDELMKQLLECDKIIKELTDKNVKNSQKADYYQHQLEDAISDKTKMINEITLLKKENNMYIEQLKNSKQNLIEKMNEINSFEQEVKSKERQMIKEKELFNQRVAEFEGQKSKIEKKFDGFKKDSLKNKDIQKELDGMNLGYGDFKMGDDDFSKKTEYPKHISKKIVKYHQSEIYAICCNLNGSLMASCSGDKSIKFYDPFNQESRGSINSDNKIFTSLSFSNLNDYLLTGTSEKTVELYNYSINKFKHSLTGHSNKINAVSFTNDREKCASSSDDRTIKIWDLEKGFCSSTINCLSSCQTMDYFNYEPTIVTGHKDGSMRLFSAKDGKMLDNVKNMFDGAISCVRLSSNNNYIITSSLDGTCLKCYDNRMKKVLITLMDDSYMNNHEYNKVCFGPDDRYIFGGNLSGNVIIWSLDNGTKKDVLKTDSQGLVICCEYNVITGNLYTGDSRGQMTIWH